MVESASTGRGSFWSALDRPIVTLLALQLMGGILLSPHSSFFPLYIKDLGYSTMVIANIVTAKQVAGLIAALLGGALSDSLGRKHTLLLGHIGYLLSSMVFLIASPTWIGVLWTIGGFGLGLHTLGAQSYLIDAAAPAYLGLISALFNWGYTLGGALGSPVVGLILERWDYGALAWVMIIFALGTIAVNQFILPRSPVERQVRTPSLRWFFSYGDIATRPTVVVLAALRFLPTVCYAVLGILIPLLLDAAGASKTTIAWYATASMVTASLSQAAVGRAADRWGPKWTTMVTFIVFLVSVFGTAIWFAEMWAVLMFGIIGIAAAWSLSTLLPSLVAEAAGPAERGRVLGFIHLWWSLAMIVGSLLGGALFDLAPGLPFWVSGAANTFSIVLLFVFYRLVASTPVEPAGERARE